MQILLHIFTSNILFANTANLITLIWLPIQKYKALNDACQLIVWQLGKSHLHIFKWQTALKSAD